MKLSTLSNSLFCAAALCLALPLAASAAGHQGCCSRHGGVSQQCSNGYVVCNDGTRSASCLCEGGSVKARSPKGEGAGSAGAGYEPRPRQPQQREAARSARSDKPYSPAQRQPNQVNRPAPNQVNRPAPKSAPGQAAPRPANVDKYGRPVNQGRYPASGKKVDKYGHAVPKY